MLPPYTRDDLIQIWNKAKPHPQYDANCKVDDHGNIMLWTEYGNRNHQYGWEVDHIIPVSKGGLNILSNLRPLHWIANVQKIDKLPMPKRTLFRSR